MNKVIHYCWFGKNPLPESAKKCIESWKKFCPDYEITEWNESNFDVNSCEYTKQAYEAKKYAFVSDYARFKILYQYGGVYFDTDVEVVANIDDIVEKGAFMGMEDEYAVAPGLGIGANPKMELIGELIELYDNLQFINKDGSHNIKTIVDYTTELFEKYGLKKKDEIQLIKDFYVYPKEYFCPKNTHTGEIVLTENSKSIHHYDASWFSDCEKYAQVLIKKYKKFMPKKMAGRLGYFFAQCKYYGVRKALSNTFKKIKNK